MNAELGKTARATAARRVLDKLDTLVERTRNLRNKAQEVRVICIGPGPDAPPMTTAPTSAGFFGTVEGALDMLLSITSEATDDVQATLLEVNH